MTEQITETIAATAAITAPYFNFSCWVIKKRCYELLINSSSLIAPRRYFKYLCPIISSY